MPLNAWQPGLSPTFLSSNYAHRPTVLLKFLIEGANERSSSSKSFIHWCNLFSVYIVLSTKVSVHLIGCPHLFHSSSMLLTPKHTGTGKTRIAVRAIQAAARSKFESQQHHAGKSGIRRIAAVFLAPTESLCMQVCVLAFCMALGREGSAHSVVCILIVLCMSVFFHSASLA